jgi:hypothetical protein
MLALDRRSIARPISSVRIDSGPGHEAMKFEPLGHPAAALQVGLSSYKYMAIIAI